MTQWSEWYTLLYTKYSDKCTPKNIKNLVTELSNLWSCARINHCADFVFWTYSLVIHSIYFSSELNYHSLMNTVMSLWFKVIVHARTCFCVYWRYNKLVYIKTAPLLPRELKRWEFDHSWYNLWDTQSFTLFLKLLNCVI